MPTIILSYRREDTAWIAGRVHDRLKGHFGEDNVFMDIDSIPFGLDFREHIQDSLDRCDILVAIVGPRWATPDESGRLRLTDETDWVRIEIEAALAKKIPVIPVLIDGAALPAPADLPEGLRNLAFRQAAPVDSARDFHPHMDRLIKAMDKLLETNRGKTKTDEKTEERRVKGTDNKTPPPRRDDKKVSVPDPSDGSAGKKKDPRVTSTATTLDPDVEPKGKSSRASLYQVGRLLFSTQGRISRGPFWVVVACDLPADDGCGARTRFPVRGVLDHAAPRHAGHQPSRGVSVAVDYCGGRHQTPA